MSGAARGRRGVHKLGSREVRPFQKGAPACLPRLLGCASLSFCRPQTPPPLAQEAPAESESKKRSSPGGARLTTWIHNNPSAEGHRRKSLSVLVEGQRRLSANVNKLLADDASSKTSADQVGERDRDTHPSAARPPPLECELACGFEVLVSVDGLHRSQMSLESVVEPWFCSASLSYVRESRLTRLVSCCVASSPRDSPLRCVAPFRRQPRFSCSLCRQDPTDTELTSSELSREWGV